MIILHNNEYFDCNAKIINNALNSLIENGKIVLITNDNDNRHLKELVNNDFIEMVIELPRELGTDNLIVISKNKVQEKSKRIFFVEFKDYWMNPYFIFYSEKILNTIEIETVGDNIFNSNFIDYFKQIKEFRENSNRTMVDRANGKREKVKLFYKINQKIVNLLEVIDNGYSLKVERYFLEKIEGAVRLGDILEPVGKIINFNADNESIDIEFEDYFSNDDLPKSGHLIEVDTLKENADSLKIIPSELQNTIRYLDKDCILIPRFKFDNLEFYDFSWLRDEEMGNFPRLSSSIADVTSKLFTKGEFVTNDILSYKIKDLTNVAPEFLAFEIQNSYIQKQFNIFKYGKIPFLSNDDFKRIEIKLPSFEDQVDWLNSGGYRIKWLEQKINELEQQIKVKENAKITIKQAVKSTNHKIARPIQNIQSALNNIKFKLRDINVDFDLKIHNDYNRTIKSSFESIAHNFSFFKSSLNELSNLETADVARLKEVNFRNFIENYEKSIKNSLNGNENYNLKFIQNIENFDNYNYIVKMDDTMLSILLNLFLDNAEKHGFIDKTKVYNLEYKFTSIKKNIFQNNEYGQYIEKHIRIIIEISNDGVPFPYNYTLNDFCRLNSCAGNTRGTGTGGFLINEYIKNHNKGQSTLELNTNYLNSKITKFTFSIPVERVVKIIK